MPRWAWICREWVQVGDGEIRALPLSEDLSSAAGVLKPAPAPLDSHLGSSDGWIAREGSILREDVLWAGSGFSIGMER